MNCHCSLRDSVCHSFQLLGCVQLFVIPWTAARQASLSFTNSRSLLKLMSIELVMPSNHLIILDLCSKYGACLLDDIRGFAALVGKLCYHLCKVKTNLAQNQFCSKIHLVIHPSESSITKVKTDIFQMRFKFHFYTCARIFHSKGEGRSK